MVISSGRSECPNGLPRIKTQVLEVRTHILDSRPSRNTDCRNKKEDRHSRTGRQTAWISEKTFYKATQPERQSTHPDRQSRELYKLF